METPPQERADGPLRSTLAAIGLALLGIIASQFTTLPALLLDPALLDSPARATIESRTVFLILNFLGFVLVGALYLLVTGRGWSYVDLRMPTKRGWLYILGGIVASIAFYFVVSILVQVLSLPAAENQVLEFVENDQTMILIMILIVFFFNAPAEEFLFRNIVQKRLYAAFTRLQSVGIASVIFALVHLPVYIVLAESALATLVSLSIIFTGSVIFGYLYAKTDNLLVPIATHAAFNAFQFGLLYLALEFDIEAAPSLLGTAVDVVSIVV